MLLSMPIRTRAAAGGWARMGATARASPNVMGKMTAASRMRFMVPASGVRSFAGCIGRARSRGRDDAGGKAAGRDPLQVGQRDDLVVKGLVVSGLGLAGEDVRLQQVLLSDVAQAAGLADALGQFLAHLGRL